MKISTKMLAIFERVQYNKTITNVRRKVKLCKNANTNTLISKPLVVDKARAATSSAPAAEHTRLYAQTAAKKSTRKPRSEL